MYKRKKGDEKYNHSVKGLITKIYCRQSKAVMATNKLTQEELKFYSMMEAERTLNVKSAVIYYNCNNKRVNNTSSKYDWRYTE